MNISERLMSTNEKKRFANPSKYQTFLTAGFESVDCFDTALNRLCFLIPNPQIKQTIMLIGKYFGKNCVNSRRRSPYYSMGWRIGAMDPILLPSEPANACDMECIIDRMFRNSYALHCRTFSFIT